MAFTLVREDGATFTDASAAFAAAGASFSARVTCPEGALDEVDLVVFDGPRAVFPVAAQRLACGNDVSLNGAFRASGATSMRVCLVWGDATHAIDRARLQDEGERAAPHALCKTLRPAPP